MLAPCFGRVMLETLWYAVGFCLLAALAIIVAAGGLLAPLLEARGFTRDYGWMKFSRGVS